MSYERLDPQARAFIDQVTAAGVPPLETMSPPDVRRFQGDFVPQLAGELEPVARIEDREIPGPGGPIPVRIYTPDAPPCGVLVYLHGGGWVIGSIETADAACRALARRTPCTVVSVGYRLAPEHRFPAAVDDAVAATQWAVANAASLDADASRVAIAGDSAGGELAAAVTLHARDNGGPSLRYQVLIYPVTDYDFTKPSFREYGSGFLITIGEMEWYWRNYLSKPDDASSPMACPMRAASLQGLPPALIIQAECDPIKDDGEAYAARLRADGVPVDIIRYDGQIHGFFTMPGVMSRAKDAYSDVATVLAKALT
jgi:acetyl esterase